MGRRARTGLWLRWALRDARRRWLQVLSIALLLALGSGMYSAMSSMSRWRVDAADASFASLRMHDLRLALVDGAYADAGELRALLRTIPDGAAVTAAEERLVVPTQVDASAGGTPIIVPGRLVGSRAQPTVDGLFVERGRPLRAADDGRPVVALQRNFAAHYELPASGSLRVSGGRPLRYVAHVEAPEYFIVTVPGADFGAEASFAVAFTSLATAQRLSDQPGKVNELVLRAPAARVPVIEAQLGRALRTELAGIGASFTRADEEPAHRLIYEDAKNDQQMLDIFAFLLLAAAAFAAFNLVSRAVEAQRREIGIGMALGVRPRLLALRPFLLGAQVAVLGVALGIPVGLAANRWLGSVMETWFQLPVSATPFEADLFIRGAAIGLALPLLATALPVWRAVRVAPVEAISVGARAARSSGLAWLTKDLRLPGGSLANMPVRNVLRTPRRTAMTVAGIGAVVTIVIALAGVIDSFGTTLDAARSEVTAGAPARMTADLAAAAPAGGAAVQRVARTPAVGTVQPSLRLPATLGTDRGELNAFVEVVRPDGPLWRPSLREGRLPAGGDGLVIARAAARELGVKVGDRVTVRHPVPSGAGTSALAATRLPVTGIHTSPFRFVAYVPQSAAGRLGLAGLVNRLSLVPAEGSSADDVKAALLALPGVVAVQHATATTDAVDEQMAQFNDVLYVTVAIALAMALLMAFNASAINADERAREHATMFAFGVEVRTVLRLGVREALIIGVLATLLGIAGGYGLLRWIVTSSMRETMPDVGMLISISPLTFGFAVLAGTAAVALAPLLTRRRLVRTDLASTLRVVE